MEAELIIIA